MAVFLLILMFLDVHGQKGYSLVIHGGAGSIEPETMSTDTQKEYRYHLDKALMLGDSVLRNGGTSTDAVVVVVSYMEDCPLFNSGKGAVFTWKGKNASR